MRRKINVYRDIDWFTVVIYLALVFMGWLNIYAAVYNEEHSSIFDLSQKYGKQLLWIVAAIVIIVVVMLIEGRFYLFFAYPIYFSVILLLIFVLLFGSEINGARSWISIGSFSLQPSEFGKFATALALSRLLSGFNFKISSLKNMLYIAGIITLPALLILLQNDTGSALVYGSFIFVLYREGLSSNIMLLGLLSAILFIMVLTLPLLYIFIFLISLVLVLFLLVYREKKEVLKFFLLFLILFGVFALGNLWLFHKSNIFVFLLAVGVMGLVLIIRSVVFKSMLLFGMVALVLGSFVFTLSVDYIFDNVLESHQRSRINHLLGIESDPLGAGYNVNQSKIAIGSGGLLGKGFLQGTQTKYDFVPEQSTDFIFCTVGEEWGFVGTSLVLVLFAMLLIRLVQLAERQRSAFSRIYGYAVVSILFFHLAINVGMTIGLAPVIGIPLPFFSYGGSSLWAFTVLLFVFLRFDASRRELLI